MMNTMEAKEINSKKNIEKLCYLFLIFLRHLLFLTYPYCQISPELYDIMEKEIEND